MASPEQRTPLQDVDPTQAVKDQARSVLKDTSSGIGDLASALRKTAREMGGGGSGERAPVSRLVESAADGLERFSGALRNKDLDGLVNDVNSFARRQPVAFFGVALAAGFLAVRFLKASGEPRGSELDNPYGEQNLPY